MAAVASPSPSPGLPTKSEIRSWDVEHLNTASADFNRVASVWQESTNDAYVSLDRTGWEGPAATTALDHVHEIRRGAFGKASILQQCAAIAQSAAMQIAGARDTAIAQIDQAISEGFTVGEDLSVTYPASSSKTADAAKRDAAQVHAAEIQAAAARLAILDKQFGAELAAQATFLAPAAPSTSGSGSVQPAGWSTAPLSPAPTPSGQDSSGGSTRSGGSESSPHNSASGSPKEKQHEGSTKRDPEKASDPGNNKNEAKNKADGETKGSTKTDAPEKNPSSASGDTPGSTALDSGTQSGPTLTGAPMPTQGGGLPASPLGSPTGGSGAGGLKPPSLPSTPTSPMTSSPGTGGGMQPAAFDKAVAGLGNNVPPAAAFTPPAGSGGAGSTAPVTSTPAPIQPPAAPPAAAAAPPPVAPAGPAPAAAPVTGHAGMAGGPMGGGMMPPLLAGGGAAPPAPMSSPPPAAPPPAAAPPPVAAASGHVNAMPPMLSSRERRSAYVAAKTGDKVGKVASDARVLCGQLMATTRKRPGVQWVVGGSLDETLIVANNIGLGWMPSNARLYGGPDQLMHAFVDGDIDLVVRRDWVGDPLRAVRECGALTGHPITMLAVDPYVSTEGVDLSAMSVEQAEIMPQNSGTDDMRGGRTRTGVVDPTFAQRINAEKEVAPIVRLMLPGAGHESADRKPSGKVTGALWNSVITDAMVSVDHHLKAWQRFCEDQLAVASYELRRQEQVFAAKERAEDYAYWEWNLAVLGQLLKAQPLGA